MPARTRMTTVRGFMAQDPFVIRSGALPLSAAGLQPRTIVILVLAAVIGVLLLVGLAGAFLAV